MERSPVNLPNALTLLRIVLVPALVVFLLQRRFEAALGVFLIAGVSDALDGFIARRFDLCTRLGAILDPLADKLLIVLSCLVLAWIGHIPWWLAVVIVARDLVIVAGAGAYYLRAGHLEMAPSIYSKANTCVQIVLVLVVIAHGARVLPVDPLLVPLFVLALATALVSGGHYVVVWGQRAAASRKA